jgi:hypothetical protein
MDLSLFLLDVYFHTNFPLSQLHLRHCCLGKNRLLGQGDEFFYATAEGYVEQSSKRYTKCVGKLNIKTQWEHIILDVKTMNLQ